ncbi:hypothetical protein ACFV0T_26930 [Streptomyces sp. NPDC059582]|uniref:hypothetical protein n=1 Tax=Streptomyces sp. NPDC059582 TaxID=3346875 RepID=UPI00369963FC
MSRTRFLVRAAVVAAVLLVTACSADPGRAPGTSARAVAPARLGHALPDDPVRMVLPATGAETRWTQGLDVFGQQVTRAAAATCADKSGIGLPQERVPVAFIRFFELPDLDFIARHGMSTSAEVPTLASPSGAVRAGSATEVSRCRAAGTTASAALRDLYVPLQQQWFAEVVSLRGDPAVLHVLRGLPDCLAEQGVPARDEQGFMAVADGRQQRAAPADLPATEAELGDTYATCMRPVEAVREPARLRLRARFLADHADEIHELRKALVPALRTAERRYGVPLVFPEP